MRELTFFFLGLQVKKMKYGTSYVKQSIVQNWLRNSVWKSAKKHWHQWQHPLILTCTKKDKSADESKYKGLIGSLLYLTASQLNIMLSVCLCARYQANPKESHLTTIKRIIKYLKGTTNVGLWYPKGTSLSLIDFSDFDFVGCKLDRKSTSGTCHLLGSSLVSWNCKKQACVALSTAKA